MWNEKGVHLRTGLPKKKAYKNRSYYKNLHFRLLIFTEHLHIFLFPISDEVIAK